MLFLVLSLLSCTPKTQLNTAAPDSTPLRSAIWKHPPGIINCIGESPYTLEEVKMAFKPFKNMGEEELSILQLSCDTPCARIEGWITITSPRCYFNQKGSGPLVRTLGITKMFYDSERHLTAAIIEIQEDRQHLLSHELGHAFGFDHAFFSGHLMYPLIELGGIDMTGMYNDSPMPQFTVQLGLETTCPN